METEEDETHLVPNVDSSDQLEDAPVTTAAPSKLQNQNTESICELKSEPVSLSNESGPPVPLEVSPIAEKEEEEGDEKRAVDAEVVSEEASDAAVGNDSIVIEVKYEMSDAGVEIKKEGYDGGDSHVAGEKANVEEDVVETDNVSDEILTAEGIEVSVAEEQFVKLAEVAKERFADAVEVDGEAENISVKEETNVALEVDDPTEQTVVMKEREVANVSVKRELLVEKQHVDNVVEQGGVIEKKGVGNTAVESEFLEKPVKGETSEENSGTDMVLNVSEQTGNLEDIHAVRELCTGMTTADQDSAMEEESEKAEDKKLENLVDDVEKAEGAAIEKGDRTKSEEPVMEEESMKAKDTELENVVEDVEKADGAATGMGDMTEAEDPVMEEESEKPQDTELENVVEGVEKAEGTAAAIGDMTAAEDPITEEESEKAEDTELKNSVKDVEKLEGTATEMEDMSEAEEDPVMEEESEKAKGTDLENVAEDVENAEETATEMEDTAEVTEAADDTEMLDMSEELETEAAKETEDAEEIEDGSKASGGKRKRGKKQSNKILAKCPSRKKGEEDVCFICFDGGDLVLCDRRGCPKAYHSACVGRDDAFFQTKGKWNCVKLAGVGFSEGTGSSIISFAQHTIKVLHASQIGLMALKRTFEVLYLSVVISETAHCNYFLECDHLLVLDCLGL